MGFVENTTLVIIVVKVKLQARFNKKMFQKWRKFTLIPRWSFGTKITEDVNYINYICFFFTVTLSSKRILKLFFKYFIF